LKIRVDSPRVRYSENFIEAEYEYQNTSVAEDDENETIKREMGGRQRSKRLPKHPRRTSSRLLNLRGEQFPPRERSRESSSRTRRFSFAKNISFG